MGRSNDSFRDPAGLAREQRRRERSKRWEERSKRFWRSLLFTENGKPKSGFLIYTFCLSAVFIGVYIGAFHLVVECLTPLTESWPAVLGNLLGSLCAGGIGVGVGLILRRLLSDKRLMLGTHLWLALYAAAAVVIMAILLRGTGAMGEFMIFFLWFAAIPVGLGLLVFALLERRDRRDAPKPPEEEPEWKKYVRRD